jgi:hypothetical protein
MIFFVGASVVGCTRNDVQIYLFLPVCDDEIWTSLSVVNDFRTGCANPPSCRDVRDVTTHLPAKLYAACIFLTLK